MRAAQIVAPRRFDIVDIADPEIGFEPPGSILVKTQRSAHDRQQAMSRLIAYHSRITASGRAQIAVLFRVRG